MTEEVSLQQHLTQDLTPAQFKAVQIVRLALNAYNVGEGSGLMQGVSRYSILTERVKIAAVQSRDLPGFWSALLRKMLWTITPQRFDYALLELLKDEEPQQVIRCLALESPYVVMLARFLHQSDKDEAKAEKLVDALHNDLPM